MSGRNRWLSAFAVAVKAERLRMRLRNGRKNNASSTTMKVAASVAQTFANSAAVRRATSVTVLTMNATAAFSTAEV